MITKYKALVLGGLLCWSFISMADTELTFIHTNDIHAHLLPSDSVGQDCKAGPDCLGGISRLQGFINQERTQNPDILVLDAGDRFAGTPFYMLHKEKDLIPLFHRLGIDALTLGNHEFDDELSVLESFLEGVDIPCVLSNAVIADSPFLEKRIVKSLIVNKKGVNIGILGALTPEVQMESMHGDDVNILPTKEALDFEIKNLKQQGISIIVLLSHLGLDADKEIAAELQDIDVIIGGHSHSLLSNTVARAEGPYPIIVEHSDKAQTLIVSTGAFGRYVGKLNVGFDNLGQITSFSGNTIPLSDRIKTDSYTTQLIQKSAQELETLLNQKIQDLPQDLLMTDGQNYCAENCAIAQGLTDMILSQIQGADVVLLNSGAIRSGWKAGEILRKDILQALPFSSEVVLTDMSGEELKNYIELGLQKYQSGKRVNALLQSAGVSYLFDPNKKQITQIKIYGKDLIPTDVYHVALPLFLAKGGDGFPVRAHFQILPKTLTEYVEAALAEKPYYLTETTPVQKLNGEKK